MALESSISQLDTAARVLQQRWEQTQPLWSDRVKLDFEMQYWQAIEKQTQATAREMQRLAQVILDARQKVH